MAMQDHHISQRRVCNLVGVDPKTVRRERLAEHADIAGRCRRLQASTTGLGIGGSGSCWSGTGSR